MISLRPSSLPSEAPGSVQLYFFDLCRHILAQSLWENLRTFQKSIHLLCFFSISNHKLRFCDRIETAGRHNSLRVNLFGAVAANQPSRRPFSSSGGNWSAQDVMSSGHVLTQHWKRLIHNTNHGCDAHVHRWIESISWSAWSITSVVTETLRFWILWTSINQFS